jgi:hypothetical protein
LLDENEIDSELLDENMIDSELLDENIIPIAGDVDDTSGNIFGEFGGDNWKLLMCSCDRGINSQDLCN